VCELTRQELFNLYGWIFEMQASFLSGLLLRYRCSERRLIGHSFYHRIFLRKSCAACREKYRRAAPPTEKSDKPAAAFFSASGAALSLEVPTVKWMSNQLALWTPSIFSSKYWMNFFSPSPQYEFTSMQCWYKELVEVYITSPEVFMTSYLNTGNTSHFYLLTPCDVRVKFSIPQ
jgi:hypothetical protein